jgi:hypothetical protein
VWFAQDTPVSPLATLSTVRPHLLFIARKFCMGMDVSVFM